MSTLFSQMGPLSRLLSRPGFNGYVPENGPNALETLHPDPLTGSPRVPLLDGHGRIAAVNYTSDRYDEFKDSIARMIDDAHDAWPDRNAVPDSWLQKHFEAKDLRRWTVFVHNEPDWVYRFSRHQKSGRFEKTVEFNRERNALPMTLTMGLSAYVNHAFQNLEFSKEGMRTGYEINLFGELQDLSRTFGYNIKTRNRKALVFAMVRDLQRYGYHHFKVRDYQIMPNGGLDPVLVDMLVTGAQTLTRTDSKPLHIYALNAPEIHFENDKSSGKIYLDTYLEQGSEGALDEINIRITAKKHSQKIMPLDRALYFWLWRSAEEYLKGNR